MKTRYSIYDAKTHLSEIIRRVRQDRSVVITDRGRDVARVVPIEKAEGWKGRIEELERLGVLSENIPAVSGGIAAVVRRPGAVKRFLDGRNRY